MLEGEAPTTTGRAHGSSINLGAEDINLRAFLAERDQLIKDHLGMRAAYVGGVRVAIAGTFESIVDEVTRTHGNQPTLVALIAEPDQDVLVLDTAAA